MQDTSGGFFVFNYSCNHVVAVKVLFLVSLIRVMAVEQSISEESICPERLRKLLLYDGLKRSYSPDYVSHMDLFLQLTEVVIQHTLFLVLLEADEYSVDKLLRTQDLESKSKGFTATPAGEVLAAIIASIRLPITTLLSG